MLKYYSKIIIRQLLKGNKQLLLNMLGLTVAFSVMLFLTTFIVTELNTGKSINNYQNIFRLSANEGDFWSARSLSEFEDRFADVKAMTKVHKSWSDKSYFEVDDSQFEAGKILFADEHFFEVFEHPVLVGHISGALSRPEQVVLTKAEAIKVFGKMDVIGKPLKYRNSSFGEMNLQVAAVIDNQPLEAMMKFDVIIPVKAPEEHVSWYKSDHWGQSRYEAYLSLFSNESKTKLEQQLNTTFLEAAPDWAKRDKGEIFLKPYKSLYFTTTPADDTLNHSNLSRINTLGSIVLVVFLLALINYVNLSTAQRVRQGRNIGMLKVLGATKWNIFTRSLFEILPVVAVTFLIAFVIVLLCLPWLNSVLGSTFHMTDFLTLNTVIIGVVFLLLTLLVCTGFIGVYFNRLKLSQGLKDSPGTGRKENLRNVLLVVQFTLSITLIISSMVIYRQNNFMQSSSMGFEKENILCIPLHDEMHKQVRAITQEFKNIAEVKGTTMASHALGKSEMGWGMSLSNAGEEKRIGYEAMRVDESFFDFFGLEIVTGEKFRSSSIRECEHIFNESAIKSFGIENIEKAYISSYEKASGEIIGVVKDFNFESLHHPITPLGFICSRPEDLDLIYIKTYANSGNQLNAVVANIGTVWNKFSNGWPFEYHFLDQTLDSLYKEDFRFSKLFLIATILSIFIGSLGLLSISIFIAEICIKEIGIRKVNGAKISEVLAMLNKDFVKWIMIAFVIATPIAYFAMDRWLENFAYKTSLSWWIFALAGILAMGIALLTVSWQSWRAATRNPVEALRYD